MRVRATAADARACGVPPGDASLLLRVTTQRLERGEDDAASHRAWSRSARRMRTDASPRRDPEPGIDATDHRGRAQARSRGFRLGLLCGTRNGDAGRVAR